MFGVLTKIRSRVDFYASHCYGRLQSCIPLSFFYAFDGIFNGMLGVSIKELLKPVMGGTLPATVTFLVYVFAFVHKAKETYDTHPDSINLDVEKEKLIDTTNMIMNKLKEDKEEAKVYLQKMNLNYDEITLLTHRVINQDSTKLDMYDLFHSMHSKIHQHSASFFDTLLSSFLHTITYFNEYLLLRYFADINLFDENQPAEYRFAAYTMLLLAVASGYQTFSFSSKPKKPSSDDVLKCITQDFRLFRYERRSSTLTIDKSDLDEKHEPSEKLKLLVSHNAAQKCYLSCH